MKDRNKIVEHGYVPRRKYPDLARDHYWNVVHGDRESCPDKAVQDVDEWSNPDA